LVVVIIIKWATGYYFTYEGTQELYRSHVILGIVMSGRLKYTTNVATMEGTMNAYTISEGKTLIKP
jgi:hypothetical protein